MNLLNQIYPNIKSRNLSIALYLTTALLVVSNFLSANSSFIISSPTNSLPSQKLRLATDTSQLNDSSFTVIADTISNNDTIDIKDDGEIKDVITYKAVDSIVYDMNTKKMYLYNGSDVHYDKIQLNADLLDFDWNTFTLTSQGSIDSSGELRGNPVFADDGKEYKAKKMKYNFKTKKGIVFEVLTKEGEAYILSEVVKKNEFDEWFGQSAKYTTCDIEDHPHFYFRAKKVKMVPGKVMVTGPANLWVGDVPTPLYLPFGIFPVKQGKRSGLVLPEYGQDAILGFFLRNGGYYWAVNDYLGLKFTGQVATNGTVGAGLNAQYALRYKFTGSLNFSYLRSRPFDPDLPTSKSTNSYSLSWTHTQDPRSMPNSSFGASVQMQSADFYQASRITDTRLLSTSFNSSVNYGHSFAGTPFSISIGLRHQQNLLNRTIAFSLPNIRLGMSRVAPFKSKVQTGMTKWYENIGITYSLDFQNTVSTFDSTLFQQSTLGKFRMGINQSVSIDAPLKILKYLNVTPAFNYQERTYMKGVEKWWDADTVYNIRTDGKVDTIYGQLKTRTVDKFNSTRNFSASLTLGTKVTGIFKFHNKYLKAIRHTFTPSVSFSYSPDFGSDFWKFYRYVQSDANGGTTKYSAFEPEALYGVPGSAIRRSQVAQMNWNLNNNFEMKTFSKKDTVNHEQKVGLFDQVNLNGGYNFIADSLRLQPFNLTVVAARIFNLINLNFNAVFDPYTVDSFNRRINTYQYSKNRQLLRFATANVSASMSLHSKQRPSIANNDAAPKYMGDYVSYNPNQVYNFDIPWNISLAYNFNISKGTTYNPDTVITVQSIHASTDFNLTPHWKVALSTGFDISRKQITLTNLSVIRDLHCWELTFNWTPALPTFSQQQFTIILHPKSATLKDLKLQKRNSLQNL